MSDLVIQEHIPYSLDTKDHVLNSLCDNCDEGDEWSTSEDLGPYEVRDWTLAAMFPKVSEESDAYHDPKNYTQDEQVYLPDESLVENVHQDEILVAVHWLEFEVDAVDLGFIYILVLYVWIFEGFC